MPGSSIGPGEKQPAASPSGSELSPAAEAPSTAALAQSDLVIGAATSADAVFDDVLQLITDQEATTAPNKTTPAHAAPPRIPAEFTEGRSVVVVPAPPPIPLVVASTAAGGRGAAVRRGRQDDAVLLITRKAVYAQAALTVGIVLLAFLAGLLIGRSGRPTSKVSSEGQNVTAEPVPLDGHVLYSLSPGQSLPDSGATVIALPAGKSPAKKIPARGLRPGERDDLAALPAADDLRSLGATVARTDDLGHFDLVVPRPGDYSLVIVSHHAERPDDQTIGMSDQQELGRTFSSPSELIGQHRYTIVSQRLAGAPRPFTHEFGPTDKE